MPLYQAPDQELEAVADLVNSAYRGDSSRQGWTTEADYLHGVRTTAATLRDDLAAHPGARLLVLRDEPSGPLLGCVWIQPAAGATWYLGMLTVRPDLQARALGRALLAGAEEEIARRGGERVEMTVIDVRDSLIAWYERRGYHRTGITKPFPYGDERFGIPLRPDLRFEVLEKAL